MTDRGRMPIDASVACPFVAFEEDRDARSDAPDPRHRCFAELRPAPRAIAHQQAYCLSSGFAACPTFTDWARREAAHVRDAPSRGAAATAAGVGLAASTGGEGPAGEGRERDATYATEENVWPRRSDRDWAAPPPWGSEHGEATEPQDRSAAAPPFLSTREAEEQSWDRPERTSDRPDRTPDRSLEAAALAGGEVAAGGLASQSRFEDEDAVEDGAPEPPMRRFAPDGRRQAERRGGGRSRAGSGYAGSERSAGAPSWETPRRSEAYPAIRPPRSMPNLSPLLLAVAALIVGALALFFIPPFLLGLGGGGSQSTPTPSVSASAGTASPSPTASASPSTGVTTYTVVSGDTMSKIAARFKVPLDQLIAANKDRIKDPNKLSIGDQLVIPVPGPASGEIPAASPSPSP